MPRNIGDGAPSGVKDPTWTAVEEHLRQFREPNPNPEKAPEVREAEARAKLAAGDFWPNLPFIPRTWGLQDAAKMARAHGAERVTVRVRRNGFEQSEIQTVFPASDEGANRGKATPEVVPVRTERRVVHKLDGTRVERDHEVAVIWRPDVTAGLIAQIGHSTVHATKFQGDGSAPTVEVKRVLNVDPAVRGIPKALDLYRKMPIVGYVGRPFVRRTRKRKVKEPKIPRAPKIPPTAEEIAAKAKREAIRLEREAKRRIAEAEAQRRFKSASAEVRRVSAEACGLDPEHRRKLAEKREASVVRPANGTVYKAEKDGTVKVASLSLNDLEAYKLKERVRKAADRPVLCDPLKAPVRGIVAF